MLINDTFLREQAFGDSSELFGAIDLQSQKKAVKYLLSVLTDERGARFLYGPEFSGRSTIIRQFVGGLPEDTAVALVQGSGLKPQDLLKEILAQFGYEVELRSEEELLRLINVFAVQQTRIGNAPVLIIESIDRMYPATLRVLSLLAGLQYQEHYAIRIVLSGSERAPQLLQSEGLGPVRQRALAVYPVAPLSNAESMRYLHGRLEACGVERPDQVLPVNICDMLHEISGGLPGLLSENAKGALALASDLPVDRSAIMRQIQAMRAREQERTARSAARTRKRPPRLIVTSNGETLEEFTVREKKVVVGRSNLADITIYDQFASKMHVLFMLYSDALVLVDLNSANGTYVNSVKVNSTILRNDDIVSLASHRIKVLDVPVVDSKSVGEITTSDTSRMKTLEEQRALKKQKRPLYDVGQDRKA